VTRIASGCDSCADFSPAWWAGAEDLEGPNFPCPIGFQAASLFASMQRDSHCMKLIPHALSQDTIVGQPICHAPWPSQGTHPRIEASIRESTEVLGHAPALPAEAAMYQDLGLYA
jgi:hypothetical protein